MDLFNKDNPILIDTREGSKDLIPPLTARRLPVLGTRLEYGDLSWAGNGPRGACSVGVEYKSVKDVLKCMTDERFAGHQLGGMTRNYDVVLLLWYGAVREEPDSGVLQELYVDRDNKRKWGDCTVGQTRFKFNQLDGYLSTMSQVARVEVLHAQYEPDAVSLIASRYRWWTHKEWEQHGSHQAIYTPPPPTALYRAPTLCRRWANQLQGIGWEKSAAVEQRFKTGLNMAVAGIQDWVQIEGIGKTIAGRVVKAIQEGIEK